ncbi:30S ribosomal protein S27e [uncultured archaeon]|nr:30S ribosomal protein S27e [uncultured archaeon]
MKGRTKSQFWRVKCACGNEQNIFSAATTPVACLVCNAPLATPRGGRVQLAEKATLVKVLE